MAGRGERIRLTGVKYIHIQYLTDIILRANIYLIKELPLLVGRQVPKLGKTALQMNCTPKVRHMVKYV